MRCEEKRLFNNEEAIALIKNALDALKNIERTMKLFGGTGKEVGKDESFYGEYALCYERISEIDALYDKVRNYMTQKPYKTDKIQLNFGYSTFLKGWVDSKTTSSDNGTQYGGYLFRKKNNIGEYDYYLGVSKNKKLFRFDSVISDNDISEYERLDYYQPKAQTIFGSAYRGENTYGKDKRLLVETMIQFANERNEKELVSQIEAMSEADRTPNKCIELVQKNYAYLYEDLLKDSSFASQNERIINALKKTMLCSNRILNADRIANKEYHLCVDIINDIIECCNFKSIQYFPISCNEFESALNDETKCMYLFKITNKDLSFADTNSSGKRKSKGRDNLHTMYFKALMEGGYGKIDFGSGSVFYRKKSIKYDDKTLKYGHHYNELKNRFSYPIIKDKRYTQDMFLFHISIIINYNSNNKKKIDLDVRKALRDCENNYVIGIDRGERNLLYISVIDSAGKIHEQFSLNEIINEHNGNTYRTNYHALLDAKEKERKDARVNWKTVENIKELKEGYISQVVHKICQLVEKYDAIIEIRLPKI